VEIRTIILLDFFIRRKSTGTPKELSIKIGLSERQMYIYLKYMKEEMIAPIRYSRINRSYEYRDLGGFSFEWSSNNN
jgi:hypothetical protein